MGGPEALRRQIEEVARQRATFDQAIAKYRDTLENGSPDDACTALLVDLRPMQAGYEKALHALTDSVEAQATERATAGHRLAAVAITRSIKLPLNQAVGAARNIREGSTWTAPSRPVAGTKSANCSRPSARCKPTGSRSSCRCTRPRTTWR